MTDYVLLHYIDTDASANQLFEVARDFNTGESILLEALVRLAFRGDTKPSVISQELKLMQIQQNLRGESK